MDSPARDVITRLFQSRSAMMVDVDPRSDPAAPERLLVLANATGTMQLCELIDGELHALTGLAEAVSDAAYIPDGEAPTDMRRRAVLSSAVGGNERNQLYVIDLDAATQRPITALSELETLTADPEHGHHLAGVSPDGQLVAYTSTRANGVDFDLWTVSLASGEHRLLWPSGGYAVGGGGFSPDGRFIAVISAGGRLPLDEDLAVVEVATGAVRWPLPRRAGEAALVGAVTWIDETSFFTSSNVDSDFAVIVRHDLSTGVSAALTGTGVDADALELVRAPGSGDHVLIESRDCATPMALYTEDGARRPIEWEEPGVVVNYAVPGPRFAPDGRHLYFNYMSPRASPEVYRYDTAAGRSTRLTHSPFPVDREQLISPELHTITSFDSEPIQLYVFRPATPEPNPPAVVLVHGGPESQAQLRFDPIPQALAAAGYAVVVPNVRGSTGYGKRFAALDDTTRRLDSVADLAAVHGALAALGADPARAVLWGQSYGGYMVLAGVSMQPQLWAAGVDIVGIANLVTFLENTSPYRRALREAEYGSLEHDHEFLIRASPLTYVDQIRAPLFVIHGRNDPRVPVTESEQLHANLTARGVRCELVIYENEGHGVARIENRLDVYPRAIGFLDEVLRDGLA